MPASALLLIRRRRPVGEAAAVEAALETGGRVVKAPIARTRIADVLAALDPDLGRRVAEPIVQWLPDLDAGPDAIESFDPGGSFETVVLASHLVNSPDAGLRRALLTASARHLVPGGRVLVEHHPLDWLETAGEDWSERDGRRLGMVDVRVDPPFVSAVSVFEVGGKVVRQPFTARVLSEDELDAALQEAGLTRRRRLSPTWLGAVSRVGAMSR